MNGIPSSAETYTITIVCDCGRVLESNDDYLLRFGMLETMFVMDKCPFTI